METIGWHREVGIGRCQRQCRAVVFSADGKWLAFWPLEDGSDLWIVPVERTRSFANGTASALVTGSRVERCAQDLAGRPLGGIQVE